MRSGHPFTSRHFLPCCSQLKAVDRKLKCARCSVTALAVAMINSSTFVFSMAFGIKNTVRWGEQSQNLLPLLCPFCTQEQTELRVSAKHIISLRARTYFFPIKQQNHNGFLGRDHWVTVFKESSNSVSCC